MTASHRVLGSVVAGLLAATGGLVGASAEAAPVAARAAAAACSGATGVTVVVDYNELGGIEAGCDATAGGYAADNFKDANFTLTRTVQDPSFVCRVNGLPGPDAEDCQDAASGDRYWSLWISDGKSGTWGYATRGVDSLRVPDGGYVAFSWDAVGGNRAPDFKPTPRQPAPAPSSSAPAGGSGGSGSGSTGTAGGKSKGTKSGGPSAKAAGSAAGTPTTAPTPSASATTSATTSASPTASPSATATTSGTAEPTPTEVTSSATPGVEEITSGPTDHTAAADADEAGFPIWLAGLVAVVVLGAAGAVPIIRARR